MRREAIYLDHHAATPLAPGVAEAMAEARLAGWANPSSLHAAGRRARALLEAARERVAIAIGARPADLVLTGGGTEACNLGVRGLAHGVGRVITTGVEHPAVAEAIRVLAERGVAVEHLETPDGAAPDPEEVARRLGPDALLAVGWVNHETGTLFPVDAWARAARDRGARAVIDATQALGKVPVDVRALGADAVAFAAHKAGGPAGAGALWVARECAIQPLLEGGAQERGRRAGTPDVVAHVGFGAACEGIPHRLAAMPRLALLRDRVEARLVTLGGRVNGAGGPRVATVTHTSHEGWRGSALVAALDLEGLAVSSGAACSSGLDAPSPVIGAMVPDAPWRARSGLRVSLGPETCEDDVERALAILERVLPRRAFPGASPG